MAPILSLILTKVLDYLASHTEDIIELIQEHFDCNEEKVEQAIDELRNTPTAESLTKLNDALEEDGQDTEQLAKILVNTATV